MAPRHLLEEEGHWLPAPRVCSPVAHKQLTRMGNQMPLYMTEPLGGAPSVLRSTPPPGPWHVTELKEMP